MTEFQALITRAERAEAEVLKLREALEAITELPEGEALRAYGIARAALSEEPR